MASNVVRGNVIGGDLSNGTSRKARLFLAIGKVGTPWRICASAFVVMLLTGIIPTAHAQHGHGGGGHGGGHMGGGGHTGGGHPGGSFHGGGGSFRSSGSMHRGSMPSSNFRSGGGTVRVAPSRAPSLGRPPAAANSTPSARAHAGGPQGMTSPGATSSGNARANVTSSNAASHGGNSIGRAPQLGAAHRSASWKASSRDRLQTVHTKLNTAVHSAKTPTVNNSVPISSTSGHLRGGLPIGASSGNLAQRGNTIRHNYQNAHHNCFNNNWWIGRSLIGWGGFGYGYGGWGYQPWLGLRPWSYWWGTPSWNSCVTWFPSYGWNQGCYYDYGPGGNVVYQDGQVVVNGEQVGTASEYAESAAELAEVDPVAIQATPSGDWLALGTFSMAVSENEVDPARVMQLAVNKDGIVSGTIHNRLSGNTYTVQGRVDKDTQRVAFTIGDDRNTVIETGIYNLTQEQTPVLCHFSGSQTQTYVLARLPAESEAPKANAAPADTAAPPAEAAKPDAEQPPSADTPR